MLTLAAMHVLNDIFDPYFTRLESGTFAADKPSGRPCDAALSCNKHHLSKGAKIAIGAALAFAGAFFSVLLGKECQCPDINNF